MEHFVSEGLGRVFVLKLEQGEFLLESIKTLAKEENIKNAVVVSGIATFDQCIMHMISTTDYPIETYIDKKINTPLEVASVDGVIADYEPHLHCVVSDKNRAYAGHLKEGCRILYLGEIVIQELLGIDLERRLNEKGAYHLYKKNK